MKYLIKGGHAIGPADKIDGVFDLLICDGKIEKIGKDLGIKADETIDAKGKIVTPGFVDMHVHLREPGREDEETIKTGTRAAIRGGFTAVACMPNTESAIDSPKTIKMIKDIIKKDILGKITLVETTTNRNSADGAWIRHLDANGNPKPGDEKSIDWPQWLGSTPLVPFSINRYYNWQKFFAALTAAHYDYVVSIEHEDSYMSVEEGLDKAISNLRQVLIFQPAVKPKAFDLDGRFK